MYETRAELQSLGHSIALWNPEGMSRYGRLQSLFSSQTDLKATCLVDTLALALSTLPISFLAVLSLGEGQEMGRCGSNSP